jgi:rubrerythrin
VDFSAIKDTHELIRIFIEFEQDTILFYDLLVAFVPEESVKAKIRTIIDEEKNHVQKLRERIRLPSE